MCSAGTVDGGRGGRPMGSSAGGVRRAEALVGRVDVALHAGLGIEEHHLPDVGELKFTGVHDLDDDDVVSCGEFPKGPFPGERAGGRAGGVEQVGDHDAQATPRSLRGETSKCCREVRRRDAVALTVGGAEHPSGGDPAGPGRQPAHGVGSDQADADAVAAALGEETDGGRGPGGDVRLLTVGRAERHAR